MEAKRAELTTDYFIKNLYVPAVAWPTVALLSVCWVTHLTVAYLYHSGSITAPLAVIVNFASSFAVFTPMHDAAHKSIFSASSARWANDLVGYLSSALFPAPFLAFKYIHLQHHKHTNDPDNDPDFWVAAGPTVLLPLRWLSIELKYYAKYLPMIFMGTRPREEVTSVLLQLVLMISAVVIVYKHGFGNTAFFAWILPGRLAMGALAYCFDYLPHRPHKVSKAESPAEATCVTSLYGDVTWLLTWPLLHQNYHVIHHFAPHIPFYQYSTVWKQLKDELVKKGVQINPIVGKAVTVATKTD
jgi:beta-carotene hydroxylase